MHQTALRVMKSRRNKISTKLLVFQFFSISLSYFFLSLKQKKFFCLKSNPQKKNTTHANELFFDRVDTVRTLPCCKIETSLIQKF